MEFRDVIAALESGRILEGVGNLGREERELRDAVLMAVRSSRPSSGILGDAVIAALIRALREARRQFEVREVESIPDVDRRIAEAVSEGLALWDEFEPLSSGRIFDHVSFPDGSLRSEREQRLRAAVSCGLETWARSSLFPGVLPTSAVVEFRRRGRDGWGSWTEVSGNENIGFDARRLGSLRSHHQLLCPCLTNHVHVAVEGEYLRLEWECGDGALDRLASADVHAQRLTLYFDVSGVLGESRVAALTEFAALGSRPWRVSSDATRDGIRPDLLTVAGGLDAITEDATEYAGPADLLSPDHAPFSDRFLRVDLGLILGLVRRESRRVVFFVRYPGPDLASAACRLLQGRIRLNHALVWNRIRQYYDRFSLQAASSGLPLRAAGAEKVGIPVVLGCVDERGNVYADERWGARFDPIHRFRSTVVGSGATMQLRLDFCDPWVTYGKLRQVRLLLPAEWPRDTVRGFALVPQAGFALDDAEVVFHEESAEPALGDKASDEDLAARESRSLLPALFASRGVLPAGHAASVLDLKRLVLARLPPEIRTLLPTPLDLADVSVSSAVAMPASQPRLSTTPMAVPVAQVTLPVITTASLDADDLRLALEALATDVERRCVAGVRVAVKLRVVDRSRS